MNCIADDVKISFYSNKNNQLNTVDNFSYTRM